MPSLARVLEAAGSTRNAFHHWLRSGLLTTAFEGTLPGVARVLSRSNALELGFMAAAVNTGLTPKDASAVVRSLLDSESRGELPRLVVRRWDEPVVVGYPSVAALVDQLPGRLNSGFAGTPAMTLAIINLEEIVRRIDALFSGNEPETAP